MARIWQEAGILTVRRESPKISERGKVPPLLVDSHSPRPIRDQVESTT